MNLSGVLRMASCTDAGRIRSHNEDAVFCDASQGLAILADGMGGYNAGEVASGMAVTLLAARLGESPAVEVAGTEAEFRQEIAEANTAILNAATAQPQYAGMGTTLVVVRFIDDQLVVAHLGDSRLYRLRAGELTVMTRDHSFLQQQIDAGLLRPEDARTAAHRNLVTRALGVEPVVEVEVHTYDVAVGDLYLLCSDGLNDMLDDPLIAEAMRADSDLDAKADALVSLANDHGGRDNISVILVQVTGRFGHPRSWGGRLMAWLK